MKKLFLLWALLMALFMLLLVACDDEYYDDEALDYEPDSAMVDDEFADDGRVFDEGTTAVIDSYEPTDCPFKEPRGYDIECGTLTVPENRGQANSDAIYLAVLTVYATDGAEYPPVIYLAGGPGSSAITEFLDDPEAWEYPFLRNRDLILLDQRGTGYSIPTLDCYEFDEADEDENPDELCYGRLSEEGIDLAAYNTAENAADVEALRRALDIAEWDLMGISYGTRLALEVMKSYPDGIRSVVLDSVFPPNADTPLEDVLSTMWALETLFAECESDDYCADEYPDLEAVFLETVAALNEDETADIYGDDLLFAVSNAFSDTDLIPLIPYVIYEVAYGNTDAIEELGFELEYSRRTYQSDAEDYSDSEGMYNSVICYDEYVRGDYERVENEVVGRVPEELEAGLLQGAYDMVTMCDFWSPRQRVDNTAVTSNLPTLILAGQYDVATPASWGYLAADTLPNSFVYEFPGTGHSLLSGVECAIDITAQFLDDPTSEPDSDCIADMDWPAFE